MIRAVVFACHDVGVAVVPRWAQPQCGRDEPDVDAFFRECR